MNKISIKEFAIESRKDLIEKIKLKLKFYYVEENLNVIKNGDMYVLSNENHNLNLTNDEYQKRELLIRRINEIGIEKVIEEAAYTWFNRIIAIRYMEIHDILPLGFNNENLGIKVLSSNDNTFEPEILKFNNLINNDLDLKIDINYYTNLKSDNEKFKYIILKVCDKLSKVLPTIFGGNTDYIDLLIPDNLLSETSIISKLINKLELNDFDNVEVIGWMYQFYIFELKDFYKENDKKYNKDSLPIMTQIFTTDSIVKYMVENSILTKFSCNGIELNSKFNYVVDTNLSNKENNRLEEITFIDPCCGSGHILVYAFDLFYEAYLNLGYNKKDIPEKIIKNNLYGIDIDDRAAQLAQLSLLLKAREYDKDLFSKNIDINICSIKESNYINNVDIFNISDNSKSNLKKLISIFYDAKEYGSILKVEEIKLESLEDELLSSNDIFINQYKDLIFCLIKQYKLLKKRYDIFVTNPPYLGIRAFDDKLKGYVDNYYKVSKHDLCTVFMDTDLVKEDGIIGMVNQTTWLTQDSFSEFRRKLLSNKSILSMLILDENVMDAGLDICTFIIYNKKIKMETSYLKVNDMTDSIICNEVIKIDNDRFLSSKDYAILYDLSENLFNIYQNSTPLYDVAPTKQGLATSDNNRFLREWFEVDYNKIGFGCEKGESYKWYPCNKGGNYRKWYGNFNKIINWEYDGKEIKDYASSLYKSYTRTIKNIPLYFKQGITWNSLAKQLGCRIVPKGFIFETKGSMMFPNDENMYYILGLTNSKVINTVAKVISPTLDFHEGPVGKLPVIINNEYKLEIEQLVKGNIEIAKKDWDNYELSWDFEIHPFLKYKCETIEKSYELWKNENKNMIKKMKDNEEKLNEIFIKIYNLENELTKDVKQEEITLTHADQKEDVKSFISYFVGCMFGRYSLDHPGLIKNYKNESFNRLKPDEDNIIPILSKNIHFDDDIYICFKKFVEITYGNENFDTNMTFIAESIGMKGTETYEDTIRRYFINDFYKDHVKTYQKKPIYWMINSGKNNGFNALLYIHRYNSSILSTIRVNYLHKVIDIYKRMKNELNFKLNSENIANIDRKNYQMEINDIDLKISEIIPFDEELDHLANQMIELDLDNGVKNNYDIFEKILFSIK